MPYWLKEAYDNDGPNLDTYMAERALLNRMIVYFLFKICGLSHAHDKLLDWGGGHGLLVRMLRDVAIDAYLYDKYEKNFYASTFDGSVDESYNFVTSFEVWEHFSNPKSDLDEVFSLHPRFLLISTCMYRDQDQSWPYLGPPKGQHVFFYSQQAMRFIGQKYKYQVTFFSPDLVFFHKQPVSEIKLLLLRQLMAHPYLREIIFALKRKWSLSSHDNLKIQKLIK